MKTCSSCKQEKPLDEYYNANNKRNKQSMCILCYKGYLKAWRESRKAQPQSVIVTSKVCNDCGLEKPSSQFGKRSINLDKKNDYCKPCWSERSIRAQKRAKERLRNGS